MQGDNDSTQPFSTLRAVRCVEWREEVPGALEQDGKPLWVATHHRFLSRFGVFVADGKGGTITTAEKGDGYNCLPVAGTGKTAHEALTSGKRP